MCGSSKKTRKKAKCVEPQKIFSKCVEAQFAVIFITIITIVLLWFHRFIYTFFFGSVKK
jgi:hypothetical protein